LPKTTSATTCVAAPRRLARQVSRQFAQRFRAAFPDLRLEVEAIVAEGDLVVARWTISGTHSGPWAEVSATDCAVRFAGVNFFRIAQRKIAEIWNVRDDLGLREQIGAPVYAGFSEGSAS
jgi:predicted ester cyclase